MFRGAATVFMSLLFILSLTSVGASFEIDATDTVTRIVDGDTFDSFSNGRIRLADVDAPESYESGYAEAKDALSVMIGGRTVYLDIDDISRTDPYDRLVCVVYVRYNSTHILNVNKALVDQGRAVVTDFTNNEFNPYSWTTYVQSVEQGNFAPPFFEAVVVVGGILVLSGLFFYTRRRRLLRGRVRFIG